MLLLCGLFCLATSSLAQSEKYVTLILEVDESISFDLAKAKKNISSILAANGIASRVVQNKNGQRSIELTQFLAGESAKITARISAGTIIEGAHFSSFPVTADISVQAANRSAGLGPLISRARAQHTNSIEGWTSAITKTLKKGLNQIGNEIAQFEPLKLDQQDDKGVDSLASSNNNPTVEGSQQQLAAGAAINSTPNNSSDAGDLQSSAPNTDPSPDRSQDKKRDQVDLTQCDKSTKRSTLMILPSSIVNRGDTLNIVSCYRTYTDDDQQVRIKTTIESKSDTKKALLNSEDFVLASGYWKSTFNFDVPSSITPGDYTLAQTIYRQGRVEYLKLDITIQ